MSRPKSRGHRRGARLLNELSTLDSSLEGEASNNGYEQIRLGSLNKVPPPAPEAENDPGPWPQFGGPETPAAPTKTLSTISRSQKSEKSCNKELVCCRHGRRCNKSNKTSRGYEPFFKFAKTPPKPPINQPCDESGSTSTAEEINNDLIVSRSVSSSGKTASDGYSSCSTAQLPSYVTTARKAARAITPKFEKMQVAGEYDSNLNRYYIGERSRSDAELRCGTALAFRLYHQLPDKAFDSLDNVWPELRLHAIYKSSNGKHYHYPVITKSFINKLTGKNCSLLAVEYAANAPFFNSLSQLVNFYERYPVAHGPDGLILDLFPWWINDPQGNKTEQDQAPPPSSSSTNTASLYRTYGFDS